MLLTKYHSMEELVDMIDGPERVTCQTILTDHGELFRQAAGSSHNHQAWIGGYWDHVVEAMNLAVLLYDQLNDVRPLPFSLSEALVVLFLHDIEKPWKYLLADGKLVDNPLLAKKTERKNFRDQKLAEYGFKLNARQQNAMSYVEGELDDYSPKQRVQWPLAAFCHMCDNTSARLWPEYPRREYDEWQGAQRISDQKRSIPAVQTDCPNCGAPPSQHQLRNYSMMWHDGDIYCRNCGAYVRMYDAG